MKADQRVYHHRGWKGCALHTISFIFNIARTSTKNKICSTKHASSICSHLGARIEQCKYLFGNEACARATNNAPQKTTTPQRKEFGEGLKSLITREICALSELRAVYGSVRCAIDVHFFWKFCVRWLLSARFGLELIQQKQRKKRRLKQFSNNIPKSNANSCTDFSPFNLRPFWITENYLWFT